MMLKSSFAATPKKYLLIVLLVYLCPIISLGQNNKIESLQYVLKTANPDTTKVNLLNQLAKEYCNNNPDTSVYFARKALTLSEKIGFKKGIADAYLTMGTAITNLGKYDKALSYLSKALKETTDKKYISSIYISIGVVYKSQGNYPEALKNFFAAFEIMEKTGDNLGLAVVHNNIGNIYRNQGNYPEALKNYFASLKIKEKMGDKQGLAAVYNNMGNVYVAQGNYTEGLKNYTASLKIKEEMGNRQGMAISYGNIGWVHRMQDNFSEALKNYFFSLRISQEVGYKQGIAAAYGYIGTIYEKQGNYPEALENNFASLKINKEIDDKQGIATNYSNIGNVYVKTGNVTEGKRWQEKALQLSKKIGDKEIIKGSYYGLAVADSIQAASPSTHLQRKGELATSGLKNYKMYVLYKDSLINEETIQKTEREKNQYEFDKKEAEAEAQRQKNEAVAEAERKKQQVVLWSVISGLLLMVLFAGFIFRSLHITKKQKQVIEQQKSIVDRRNKEIEEQKKIVEEKNKDITDSINYAKRIQQAKLPEIKQIQKVFPDSFVLFKPKDIVSGDFYYFHFKPFISALPTDDMIGNGIAFIAAADCTGHGVPGAFMSMIGSEILDEAIIPSSHTSEILSFLNHGIKKSLHQTGEDGTTRDGMDIAMCALEFPMEKEKLKLKYAAANRPLWILRKNSIEVEEIKATKKAIGGFTENAQHFETHEIEMSRGDTFYIFSDGYADTFGGKEQKKIMTKKFKEILLEIQNKTMKEQERCLNTFVEEWKAGREQVDDILVIGIRL